MSLAGTANPLKSGFSGLLGSSIFSANENASPGSGRSVEAERSIPNTKRVFDVGGLGLEVLSFISSWGPIVDHLNGPKKRIWKKFGIGNPKNIVNS